MGVLSCVFARGSCEGRLRQWGMYHSHLRRHGDPFREGDCIGTASSPCICRVRLNTTQQRGLPPSSEWEVIVAEERRPVLALVEAVCFPRNRRSSELRSVDLC